MTSRSSTISLFGMLLFVNIALLSTMMCVSATVKEIRLENGIIIKRTSIPSHKSMNIQREPSFIGDLVVGERYDDEYVEITHVEAYNGKDEILDLPYEISADPGTIHYVSLINDPTCEIVFCGSEDILGDTPKNVSGRLLPHTAQGFTVEVAYH